MGIKVISYLDLENSSKKCIKCNTLLEIGSLEYIRDLERFQDYSLELHCCRECKELIVVKFNLFYKGHIADYVLVASEDWYKGLSKNQIKIVGDHFKKCDKCKINFENSILDDLEFELFLKKYL